VHFNLICQQGEAIFRVQDEGIGIPQPDQEQLFNSFHRASNVGTISVQDWGSAIVKKSVDFHKGTIVVQSEVGVGTTFTVTLPLHILVQITLPCLLSAHVESATPGVTSPHTCYNLFY
jgi:chemotaxis family two-component system sensor kinase Cph1